MGIYDRQHLAESSKVNESVDSEAEEMVTIVHYSANLPKIMTKFIEALARYNKDAIKDTEQDKHYRDLAIKNDKIFAKMSALAATLEDIH